MSTELDALDIAALRDLTLQKIGANIYNFARMEAMLRFVVEHAQVSAPIDELPERHEMRRKKHEESPMGALAAAAAAVLHSRAPEPPADNRKVWIRFELNLADGGSRKAEWRKMMRAVVRERNHLVHRRIAAWKSDSPESC